jgi:hypothetical protein
LRRLSGKGGRRCQDTAVMENGRCRRHGGKFLRGVNAAGYKTGRYSMDLPTRVAARYESALADPELLSVRDDIALLQGAITDVMAELAEAEARPDLDSILGSVEKISSSWQGWDWTRMNGELDALKGLITSKRAQATAMRDIRELIKEKASLVAQENRLLADRQQMITVEQFMLGMRALGAAVRRLVDDPATLRAIDVEFRRLASVPDREKRD